MRENDFSIVVPVKDEYRLMTKTLPTYYMLEPDELILCMDKPPHMQTLETAVKVSRHYSTTNSVDTRILFVERNPEYNYHQAWVRRRGFLEACNDVILTGDIDLLVNRNALKAVDEVGINGVGLCSVSKMYLPRHSVAGIVRTFVRLFMTKIVSPVWKHQRSEGLKRGNFTGLYAFYRPYWLDSEDEEIKELPNPKKAVLEDANPRFSKRVGMGEDTYLRDCMKQKHKVKYLPDLGCVSVRPGMLNTATVQFERGRYYHQQGRSLLGQFLKSFIYLQPHQLRGWMYEKKREELAV